ncbi:hypothetical protein VN97_g5510 [Penicillium thymicola]|uniref:Uncharacterized protein n=1 Tax=Penicillium thymicola TaxID=293382 RepID=A0AAI9X8C1_PENTH|nr:hypothetical protein VN97_g5510 [Penicillium thymicola]
MEEDGQRWINAAELGRYEEMQSIASRVGPDHLLEIRADDGKTALHLAAEHGDEDILWYLLKQGACVAARDVEKRTAFVLAAQFGNSGLLKRLRDYGADINAREIDGHTAFLYAASRGHLDTVKEIFERETVLGRAGLLESRNTDRRTGFLLAARYERFPTLKYLVDQGSNTTDRDKNQDSALDLAIKAGNIAIVKWLLLNDGNINSRDVDEENVLHRACAAGNLDIIDALLTRPLNISEEVFHRLQREMMTAQSAWGKTPLEVAVSDATSNRHEIVLRLLKTEVHSPRDLADFEPYISSESEQEPIIELLSDWINKPEHPEPEDPREREKAHDLKNLNRAAVTFFSLSHGLDKLLDLCLTRWVISDLERDGDPPWVNVAALGGSVYIMKKVLETMRYPQPPGDIDIPTLSPLHLAAKHGHQGLLSFLLHHPSPEQHEPGSDFILKAILKSTSLRLNVEGDSDENTTTHTLISLATAGGTKDHHETKTWLWTTLSARIMDHPRSFARSVANFQVFLELVARFESLDIVDILKPVLRILWGRVTHITGVEPPSAPKDDSATPGLTALYQAIALGFPTVAFHFLTRRGYLNAHESSECLRIMEYLSSDNAPLGESLEYEMIKDILDNHPRVTHRQTQVVDHTPIGQRRSGEATGETCGEIIDFWNYQEKPFKFRVKRSPITDIVDTKGPGIIMKSIKYHYIGDLEKHILDRELGSTPKPMQPDIRWIHIPVNNLAYIENLVYKIFEKKDSRSLSAFVRQSGTEVRAGGIEKRYMNPKCVLMRTPDSAASGDLSDVEAGGAGLKVNADEQGAGFIRKMAIFMPFISWQKFLDILPPQGQAVGVNGDPNQQRNRQSFDIGKTPHESMTLDQFYHVSLSNTTRKDSDQVLGRYYGDSNTNPTNILIVDQLWLWILDDKTIITSTTAAPEGVESVFFDRVLAALRAQEHISSVTVHSLMHLILNTATTLFRKQDITVSNKSVSPLGVFRETIVKVTTQETELFDAFKSSLLPKKNEKSDPKRKGWFKAWRKPQNPLDSGDQENGDQENGDQENEQHDANPHLKILEETKLLEEVKDIHGELNILKKLAQDQENVWRQALQPQNDYGEISGGFSPSEIKAEIEEMIQQTEMIKQSLSTLLDLKQKQANIFEAEYTRKQSEDTAIQGDTVMVFTVVTILFVSDTSDIDQLICS